LGKIGDSSAEGPEQLQRGTCLVGKLLADALQVPVRLEELFADAVGVALDEAQALGVGAARAPPRARASVRVDEASVLGARRVEEASAVQEADASPDAVRAEAVDALGDLELALDQAGLAG
jgi:hypothetical protein